jgi:Ala-tRNA(Pro) deacylase
LSISGQLAMVVVPAAREVDLDKCSDLLGHNQVRLATEDEFVATFADSEPGAEPPFGNLYGVPVFLDERLRAQDRMVCRDGTHTASISLAVADYVRVVTPRSPIWLATPTDRSGPPQGKHGRTGRAHAVPPTGERHLGAGAPVATLTGPLAV